MFNISSSAWFPVLTLLIGFGTKYVTDFFQDKRLTDREREARQTTLRYKFIEKRIEFQHETLLSLQESIVALGRATGKMHHQDIMAFLSTGKWQKQLYSDDLSENARLRQSNVLMLAARVRDETVRKLAEDFKGQCMRVVISSDRSESEENMLKMNETFELLNQKIGGLLRRLDSEEDDLIARSS